MGNVKAPYSGFNLQGGYPQFTIPETYGTVPIVIPTGWQLPATNYVTEQVPIELIYPRPDAETAAWTKHRRHHPSTPYFCPVGCAFGSWPFYFEAINLPAGATINSFLTVSGDKLVAGPDYGVVRWATPIAGTYPMHIRVHQQGSGTRVDVHWTLEVTETGTIFIDSVSGNDTTGTGTFALPFKTIEAWWLGDETDVTYSEYQVCYRAGTHVVAADNTTTGITGGNWQMNGTDKPLIHYGHADEAVVWDMTDCTIVVGQVAAVTGSDISGSDMFFGNITQDGGPLLRDDPRQFFFSDFAKGAEVYASGEGGARNTWFNTTHSNFVVTTKSDNNAGVVFCGNPALTYKRHYWYQSQITFDTINMDPGATNPSNGNLNGFFLSGVINWLAEHGSCIDTDFGKGAYDPKAGARYFCIRNVDYTLSPLQHLAFVLADSYDVNDGGPYEMSYCKSLKTDTDTLDFNLTVNSDFNTYDSGNPNHLPVYLLRNTFSRSPVTSKSSLQIRNGWPVVEIGAIYVADDVRYLETDPTPDGTNLIIYDIASNPLDASLDLTGAERTANLGKFGAEVSE